ncbi:hypothetical protein JXB28_01305 [Candidatus Woesearchaeota archaeon]|nr:hypothetical protein [Candidatus Woesearchaeota archaeon]
MEDGKKEVRVAILTPYLTVAWDEVVKEFGEKRALEQKEKYGFVEDHLGTMDQIVNDKYRVILDKRDEDGDWSGKLPHLAISGCTERGEDEVRGFRGSGIIFGRYSIFYGGCSDYTGFAPADSGYALDIPKRVDVVKRMLTDDDLLEALVLREERKIKAALDDISKGFDRPILVTPYLKKALEQDIQ